MEVIAFGYKMQAARVCYPSGWFRTPVERAKARTAFIAEMGTPQIGNFQIEPRLLSLLKKQYLNTGLCSGWDWKEKYRPDVKRPDYGAVEELLSAIQVIGLKKVSAPIDDPAAIEALKLTEPREYKLDIVRRDKKDRVMDSIFGWLIILFGGIAGYFIYAALQLVNRP